MSDNIAVMLKNTENAETIAKINNKTTFNYFYDVREIKIKFYFSNQSANSGSLLSIKALMPSPQSDLA